MVAVVAGGVVVTFVAIAISSNYQQSAEGTLRPGGQLELGDFQLTFESVVLDQQPHLAAQRATISLTENGKSRGVLEPALNFYPTMREPLGTPAVRSSLVRDLYLTVMNVGNDGSIGLRAILTPAVAWVWIGVLAMGFGTALCIVGAGSPKGKPA